MQSGIFAIIRDLAEHTGHNTVDVREILKAKFWDERPGTFSLSLVDCNPVDANDFYNYLLDLSMDLGIQYSTWTEDP